MKIKNKVNLEILKEVAHLNNLLTPFLYVVAMSFALIECFTYVGFLKKFFGVNSIFFISISILSAIIYALSDNLLEKANEDFMNLVLKVNLLLLPVFFSIYYMLTILEMTHYPNYVFATYHIQENNLVYIIVESLFMAFIFAVKYFQSNSFSFVSLAKRTDASLQVVKKSGSSKYIFVVGRRILYKFLFSLLAFSSLFYFFVSNFSQSLGSLFKNTIYIKIHFRDSFSQKMEYRWPTFYDYMMFVKDNTPEDATIVIPPQSNHWLSTGNSSLVRYFLYPRHLVHGEIYSVPTEDYDYILISWGLWKDQSVSYGWPKVNVKSKEVIYWEQAANEAIVVPGNYVYSEVGSKSKWGLIRIK